MNKHKVSLFISAILSSTLLLSACGSDTQQQAAANTNNVLSLVNTNELTRLATHSAAHWLAPDLLVLPKSSTTLTYQLVSHLNSDIEKDTLSETMMPAIYIKQFPHLKDFQAYRVKLSSAQAKNWLKTQLFVVGVDKNAQLKQSFFVQTGAVIDVLYTQGDNDADEIKDFGATIMANGVHFKLWAPTAQQVELLLFNDDLTPAQTPSLALVEDTHTGVWSVRGDRSLNGAYYQYQVTVYHPESKRVETLVTTDPYSLSLSVNSKYSQVVDLNDPLTQPLNWENHNIPTVKNVEDNIFYETHIRDFSSDDMALSDDDYRGKYKAFSEHASNGIKHLKVLQKAGLNNIHLLPSFDIATVNEQKSKAVSLNDTLGQVKAKVCHIKPKILVCTENYDDKKSLKSLLETFNFDGTQLQQIVSELREFDNYNWGYDPYHYTVPEGSYAVNPKGTARLLEFREMIQSIHGLGFRVIMDVVYNHTHQSGLEPNAVLDKIVPNYYHRLHPITGAIEQSTCCDNTAVERVMMAKLMSDSLVVWARDYKIDGFRFDLMGHQTKPAMLAARTAVRAVDSDTYFYGEGWNFGEVANNSRFEQASQLNLGGTEIGTYSDRLRDAVRGGGNNTRNSQGIGNGLLMQPNERQHGNERADYDLRMDQLRIGLAGNIATFPLKQENGKAVLGKDVPYGDQPTGYALDPADTINYVSKHDNQTLWDNSQYRLPFDVSTDDRVRMHLQSLSFVLFAQGIPFLHMGSEFMRSKSFLRDSYDYGDWFNRVDFSKQSNFYNGGLPPAEKDQDNWPLIQAVLKGHQGRDHVQAKHIEFSAKIFEEMLALRTSSPLFRLTTAKKINEKMSFLNVDNQQLGLLVMKLDDTKGESVDSKVKRLIVIFNTSTQTQTFAYPQASTYQLHPIQLNSVDEIIKHSKTDEDGFTVPALSSVVFVKY